MLYYIDFNEFFVIARSHESIAIHIGIIYQIPISNLKFI